MVHVLRSLDELTAPDSDWPRLLGMFEASAHDVIVIPPDPDRRAAVVAELQVTVASTLGALAWNSAMVLVDHGWIRLIGAGLGSVPGLQVEVLDDPATGTRFEGVIAAYDVLGGRFAVHGSGREGVAPGEVLYWGPDTLDWTPLGMGHSALVDILLSDRLAEFARDLRWTGWEHDVEATGPEYGLAAYPPPWSVEGRGPGVSRRPVPMAELVAAAEDTAAQLRAAGDPARVRVRVDDA